LLFKFTKNNHFLCISLYFFVLYVCAYLNIKYLRRKKGNKEFFFIIEMCNNERIYGNCFTNRIFYSINRCYGCCCVSICFLAIFRTDRFRPLSGLMQQKRPDENMIKIITKENQSYVEVLALLIIVNHCHRMMSLRKQNQFKFNMFFSYLDFQSFQIPIVVNRQLHSTCSEGKKKI
jgi:hypothetical protein